MKPRSFDRIAELLAVALLAACGSQGAATGAGTAGAPTGDAGGTSSSLGGQSSGGGLAAAGTGGVPPGGGIGGAPAGGGSGGEGTSGAGGAPACASCGDGRLLLHDGWQLQSSKVATASGAEISSVGFSAQGWYPIQVPSTVFAGLVRNGVYPDPDIGDNLSQAPASIAQTSWWFRTEVTLPPDFGPQVFLDLDGINYRAAVWLNGQQVADDKEVVGTFTAHEWNVTSAAHAGANALAIEIWPPDLQNDLALTWLDWNPAPPDRDTGIWQPAYLKKSGTVALRNVRVTSQLSPGLDSAALSIKADLVNTSDNPVHTSLSADIDALHVTQNADLMPSETKTVTLDPSVDPALTLAQPRLWWPAQLGKPELYQLKLTVSVNGATSDQQQLEFGIRDVKSTLTPEGYRLFSINGKRILIRGGGWASDMLLRQGDERLDAQFQYVLDLGLNTIRLEGKLESDEFYAAADRYGVLLIPGWMCCDHWQEWGSWSAEDHQIAIASTATQAQRLRNHPSVIDFLIGSDEAPPAQVESEMLGAFQAAEFPDPIGASAANRSTPTLGRSGMKMNGPYDWIAPGYWLQDSKNGGAFGFSSEVGPGPAIPELDTLQAMLTPAQQESLWTKLNDEQYHAGTNGAQYNFGQMRLFNEALSKRHGAPTSLVDYVEKAQLMSYEAERAPFEAYGRNKYSSATGIIHWLLNNAWPSLIWHLYGYDLSQAGAYFGAKKGNEPLHIMYSYGDRSVVVLNHTPSAVSDLSVSVRIYNLDASQKYASDTSVSVDADSTAQVLTLPVPAGLSPTYFVDLSLKQADEVVSRNLYWLSTKAEQIDFGASDWYHAPTSSFADYTALSTLPQVTLSATLTSTRDGERGSSRITLHNDTSGIAFFTRLELLAGKDGKAVWPVLWQDNYVSLLPGETRSLTVSYALPALGDAAPAVALSGFNQARQVIGG